MPEPLVRQFSSFTFFLFGGMALGFAFDLLAAVRQALRPRGLASFLLDLAYWAVAFAVVFPLLVLGTRGELRVFVWPGLGCRAGYYRLFLHKAGAPLARLLAAPLLALWGRKPTTIPWPAQEALRAEASLPRGGRRPAYRLWE